MPYRNLPFELTSEALANWMDSLRKQPQAQAAHQLNQVLKLLKDVKHPPAELLPLLVIVTPVTLHFANGLAAASESKESDKSRKTAKLSMQLLRQLGLIFCQLAELDTLTSAELQTANYYALQCIGYCLRCYSLFYETPSATLWKKSASLYDLAASNHYLQVKQSTKLPEFKQHPTIESVIKRNLLFSVLTPSLYATREINQIFLLANQYADLLNISTAPETWDFDFYWDLNDEAPPCPTRKSRRPLPHGFLAIDSQQIGQILLQNLSVANLDRNAQNILALRLSGYQAVFDSIIPGQPSKTEFLIGFSDVCAFLLELNKLHKIRLLSGHPEKSLNPKRDMALVPMEHEKNAFETMSQALAKTNTISKSGNVLRISHSVYLVAEGSAFDCSTGDIAMFYKDQEPATLAIIRQQSASGFSNVIHILMEKLIGHYSIYTFKTGTDNQYAIVIDEDSDNRQVFLPAGKYAVDSLIPLTIDESLRLTACLESNSFFARYKFNFDS